jgi:hypothetical protein
VPWITLTEEHVLTVLAGPELAGYRAAALADGQDDPVEATLADVTEYIRGFVAGCASNTLGEAGTIPARLKTVALDLLAVRIPQRVGRSPKPGRKDAADKADALLKLVAQCRFAVDVPESGTESDEEESAPSPSFSGRDRRNARLERDGL